MSAEQDTQHFARTLPVPAFAMLGVLVLLAGSNYLTWRQHAAPYLGTESVASHFVGVDQLRTLFVTDLWVSAGAAFAFCFGCFTVLHTLIFDLTRDTRRHSTRQQTAQV